MALVHEASAVPCDRLPKVLHGAARHGGQHTSPLLSQRNDAHTEILLRTAGSGAQHGIHSVGLCTAVAHVSSST